MRRLATACWVVVLLAGHAPGQAADPALPDIWAIKADLTLPPLSIRDPAAGHRVAQTTADWKGTGVHHLLYLPTDWKPNKRYPVLVEYGGNGAYRDQHGDTCDGTVEGCRLGFGLSGGKGYLWLCLPFVEITPEGEKQNAVKWWGNVEETKRYCIATVGDVCERWGGDSSRVILCGFSRGSIACNYIGLNDDTISKLWAGFFCHSHYDGVIEGWRYANADRASALQRLQRLGDRPQLIVHEGSVHKTEAWLSSTGINGDWTFLSLPFRNHSDAWVLRDIPSRSAARDWLLRISED